MKAKFFINKSDSKKVDKELEYLFDFDITLKTASDLIRPTIDLQVKFVETYTMDVLVDDNNNEVVYNDFNISINRDLCVIDANYCYIEALKRYYYIDNFILVTPLLYRLSLIEDELMTLKDQFKVLDGYITRNQFTYNGLVKDELTSFYYDKLITYFELNEGGDTTFNTNTNYKTNNISLCVINNRRSVVSQAERPIAPSTDLTSPYFWNGGIIAYNNVYCADVEDINNLSKWLVNDNTLASFVLKMTVFPFALKAYGGISHLWLGKKELVAEDSLPTININELICPQGDFYTICDKLFFPDNSASFLSREPFAKYEIYIPYVSYIPVDADKIIGKRIKITYALDYKSGNAQVYVLSDNKVIFTTTCQLGVDIPINSTNSLQVQNNNISNAMGLSLGLIGGAVGIFSGNPIAVAGGVMSAGKSISSFINNNNTNYNNASGSYANANGGLFGKSTPHIRITSAQPNNYNNDFFKMYGRPLNRIRRVGDFTGFTKIEEIHLDNINATEEEKRNLKTLLTNGIIL